MRLWQVSTGTPRTVLTGHTNTVDRCVFSSDGAAGAAGVYLFSYQR